MFTRVGITVLALSLAACGAPRPRPPAPPTPNQPAAGAQLLPAPSARRRDRVVHPRVEAQMRRRAAELLALLRGLD